MGHSLQAPLIPDQKFWGFHLNNSSPLSPQILWLDRTAHVTFCRFELILDLAHRTLRASYPDLNVLANRKIDPTN